MQKYKTLKTLGDGAFGTVYKAQNTKTGQIVAIKKMKQKYNNWNQCIQLREIKSLRKLNHNNIIKLKEVLLVSQQLYMVFQYLDYNIYEVYSNMKQQNKYFTQHQIKNIIVQIVSGLAHMHKNGFFHRDMKPQNLLIYNNIVKICDLGLARQIRSRPPFTDYVSTRWYRAPQLLLRSTNYNSPVDIFALGCIIAQLYTLCPLFPGNNQIDQLNKIVTILGTPDRNQWPQGYKLSQMKGYYFPQQKGISLANLIPNASVQGIDLIQSMLNYSSRKRPTAIQILKHEYFKGINIPNSENNIKQIMFDQKPIGIKLDTIRQDKNIQQFRLTKQKFKKTRKNQANENNFWKNINQKKNQNDINHIHEKYSNNTDDLDSLIKQLQQKSQQKIQNHKLPSINNKQKLNQTKQKFTKSQKKQLRQSKTQLKHGQPFKLIDKQQWKYIRNQESQYKSTSPPSKKQILPHKFSFNFQPVISLPYPNISNRNANRVVNGYNLPLGYLSKNTSPEKKKIDLNPNNQYKF